MIVNDEQRRTMKFIAVVNRGGYRPTGPEINQWRLAPDPKPPRKGKLLEAGVPATPDRRVRRRKPGASQLSIAADSLLQTQRILDAAARPYREAMQNLSASLVSSLDTSGLLTGLGTGLFDQWEYETIPGQPGKAARYAADKRAERFLEHLRRLRWIERDSRKRYGVTMLGRALLAADVDDASQDDKQAVVVLAPEDRRLGYGRVLGRISESGDTLVADPYLGTDELMDLIRYSDVSRFLIGPRVPQSRVTELCLQMQVAEPTTTGLRRELRRSTFHDRYIVGEQNVFTLTASLNGVSKSSMALLVEMTDVAADAVRSHVESLWPKAEVLARGLSQEDLMADTVEPASKPHGPVAVAKVVSDEEDGRFRHEGCNVRHKSRQAARNCSRGTKSV